MLGTIAPRSPGEALCAPPTSSLSPCGRVPIVIADQLLHTCEKIFKFQSAVAFMGES